MDATTLVPLAVGLLALLLVVRLAIAVPGWIRRFRRPETRAIRVVGVGGAGSNAVDRMVEEDFGDVDYVACNTDAQALRRSVAPSKLRIGGAVTGGLGSGGDPEIGRRSAEEGAGRISDAVAGADLVFVTAGLGGGTGSGAAPLVAEKAKERGALTIGVVTKPFAFEGTKRRQIAEDAARQLTARVDALIVIPNDRVDDVIDRDATVIDAFRVVDGVLVQAVHGLIDLLTVPGLVNVDFADVRAVMQDAGPALIGLGRGSGEQRATDAAREAIASPLLEARIDGAHNLLFNISGPPDLQLHEVREAADEIRAAADADANVIFGASLGEPAGGDVLVTLIATGLNGHGRSDMEPDAQPGTLPSSAPTDRREPKRRSRVVSAPSAPAPGGESTMPAGVVTLAPAQPDQGLEPRHALVEGEDIDVPSFLRRKQPTSNGS